MRHFLPLVLATPFLLASCGGDDKSSSDGPTKPAEQALDGEAKELQAQLTAAGTVEERSKIFLATPIPGGADETKSLDGLQFIRDFVAGKFNDAMSADELYSNAILELEQALKSARQSDRVWLQQCKTLVEEIMDGLLAK